MGKSVGAALQGSVANINPPPKGNPLGVFVPSGAPPNGQGAATGLGTASGSSTPPVAASKYRDGQTYLFQHYDAAFEHPYVGTGWKDFPYEVWGQSRPTSSNTRDQEQGPNKGCVAGTNNSTAHGPGWPWSYVGGDILYLPTIGVYGTYLRNTAVINVATMHAWHRTGPTTITGLLSVPTEFSMSCTQLMQFIQTNNRWNALYLARESGAARNIGGIWTDVYVPANATNPTGTVGAYAPRLVVTYTSNPGVPVTLACRLTGPTTTPADRCATTDPARVGGWFVEFERPTEAVSTATLYFTIMDGAATTATVVGVWPLDPPRNTNPIALGLADGGPYDSTLAAEPTIYGTQTFPDGTLNSQYIDDAFDSSAIFDEANWDPVIWWNDKDNYAYSPDPAAGSAHTQRAGARAVYGASDWSHDYTKFPHTKLNKWFDANLNNPDAGMDVVNSSYTGFGFQPLYPGHGALRIWHNPAKSPDGTRYIQSGDVYSSSRTDDGHQVASTMMLPEPLMGQDNIFVRYYFRIGSETGFSPPRIAYSDSTGFSKYDQHAGKFGVTPWHPYYGYDGSNQSGFSGSGGGGQAWESRLLWADFEGATTGPQVGSWSFGFSSNDYSGAKNPPGFTIFGDDVNDRFGQIGGRAGALYYNTWYCLEYQFKLNSVIDPATGAPWAPDGLTQAQGGNGTLSGFKSDGEIRIWLDGVLCYERTNAVMRTMPHWYKGGSFRAADPSDTLYDSTILDNHGYIAGRYRPTRNRGMKYLTNFMYFGGQYPAHQRYETFMDHIAYGTEYIGPLRTTPNPTTTPAWLTAAGNPLNTWVEIPNSKMSTDMVDFSIQYTQGLSTLSTITAYNVGNVFVTDPGLPFNPDTLG